jgi:hypothetical protein
MINRIRLPVPAFRQRHLELCVPAAYATVMFPFTGLHLNTLLVELKSHYSVPLSTEAPTDPGDYYQTHAQEMASAQFCTRPGLLGWMEHLHTNGITAVFAAAGQATTARIEDDIAAVESALRDEEAMACVALHYDRQLNNVQSQQCCHPKATS